MSGDEELFGDGDGDKFHMGWFPSQREYFAAKALQGIRANPEGYLLDALRAASEALQDADALIALLNEP